MKIILLTLLSSGLLLVSSCGGWSSNQKEVARTSIGDGFEKGLASNGAKVDPKVKEAWLDCVIEKSSKKWSFDDFSKGGSELEKIQEDCATEVNLEDGITVE